MATNRVPRSIRSGVVRVDKHGLLAGAGPLRITANEDTAPSIHIGLGNEGMYVEAHDARRIAKALVAAAEAVAGVEASTR